MITWRVVPCPIGLAALLLASVALSPAAAVPLDCGSPVTAHLATPMTTDVYTVTVVDGEVDQLALHRVDPSGLVFTPTWRLLDKNNTPYIGWNTLTLYDLGPLPAAGSPYRVEVEDDGHDGTGTYRIGLVRLSAPASCGAVALDCGVSHGGTLANELEADLWTFTAAEGEMVQINFAAANPSGLRFNPMWRVLNRDGVTVAWWNGYAAFDLGPLTAAGSPYCIEVVDGELDDAGSYRIELLRLTAAKVCETTTLACAGTLTRTLEPLDADLLGFDAIEGEIVEIGLGPVDPSGLSFLPYWRVLDKTGNTAVGWNGYGRFDVGPLPVAGSPYRIEVADNGLDHGGSYRVHLERLNTARACSRDLLPYGVSVTRRIAEPFACDLLGFRAVAGQPLKLFLDPVDPSELRFDPYWRILDKDGAPVVPYITNPSFDIAPLPASGNPYRIEVVDGSHDASGNYRLTLNGTDPTGVEDRAPRALALTVSPNPVRTRGWVTLELPSAEHVRLELFDVGGRLRATLLDAGLPSGRHPVAWETRGLERGMYYWRLSAGGAAVTRRAVVLD